MKKKLLFYLFFLSQILQPIIVNAQSTPQDLEKLFLPIQKKYQKGAYKAALTSNKQVLKKNITQEAVQLYGKLLEAQILEALGRYDQMQDILIQNEARIQQFKPENTTLKAKIQLTYTQVWAKSGQYEKALQYWQTLYDETTKADNVDTLLLAEIQYLKAQIQAQRGYFKEALQENDKSLTTWENAANLFLDKKRKKLWADQYLKTTLQKAQIYTQQGDYVNAIEWITQKENQHKKLLKTNQFQQFQYDLAIAQAYYNNDDNNEAFSAYKKVIKNKAVKKSQRDYLTAYCNFVRTSFYEQPDKIIRENIEYADKILYTYYMGKNIPRLEVEMLKIDRLIDQNRFKKALNDAEDLALKYETLLKFPAPIKNQLYERLFFLHNHKGIGLDKAEQDLDTLLQLNTVQMGENAPNLMPYIVKKAVFTIENTDDVAKGKNIMASFPQNIWIAEVTPSHQKYVTLLNDVAKYYEVEEKYDTALVISQQALELLKQKYTTKNKKLGYQYQLSAELKLKLGHYKEAEADMQEALNTMKGVFKVLSTDYADALASMARLYGIIGLYEDAENLLRKATRMQRILKADASQSAKAAEELAFLYARIGQFAETEALLSQVIAEKEARYGLNSKTLINPLNQMAYLYLIMGDYKNTEKLARRAAEITANVYGKNTLRYTESLIVLAKMYMEIGDYERAEEFFNVILERQITLLGENHIAVANTMIDIGYARFYQDAKNLTQTEELFKKAQAIILNNFDDQHPLYADALKNIAFVAIEKQDYGNALQTLQQSDNIWITKLGQENINSAEIAILKGDIYSKQKQFTSAQLEYQKAQTLFGELLNVEHPRYIKTLSKQGQVFFVNKQYKEANRVMLQTTTAYLKFLDNFFPTLSEREKTKFWALMKPDFEFFNSLVINQPNNDEMLIHMYNNTISTKGLLLNSSIKVRERILNGNDEALKQQYKLWIEKKEFLTSALSMSETQLKEDNIKINEIEKEIEKLEKELSEKSTSFAQENETKKYAWEDIKSILQPNEALIEMVRFRYYTDHFTDTIYYAALIVTPETQKAPQMVLLKNGKDLETKILNIYRNTTKLQQKDKLSYKNYWQPIVSALPNTQKFYLSPDVVYNQINISALLISDSTYVIDKYQILPINNTRTLVELFKEKQQKNQTLVTNTENTALLIGNPTFYTGIGGVVDATDELLRDVDTKKTPRITDLPGTGIELEVAKNQLNNKNWKTIVLLQTEATEEQIKKIESPTILHFATHGFFAETKQNNQNGAAQNPLLRSGLLLAGSGDILNKGGQNYNAKEGILTAAEAMNLPLDKTDLVILSACETGLGEIQAGEGVFGLQRSFLVAGADVLIMSLFKVSDEVTQKLINNFYERLLTHNDKRRAFYEAQMIIKQQYPYPRFWGAFIMVGNE